MKAKKKQDKPTSLSQKLKAGGVAPLIRRGEWQHDRPKTLKEREAKAMSNLPRKGPSDEDMKNVQLAIVERRAAGRTDQEIAEEFGLKRKTVNAIINTKFVNNRKGAEVLRGLLLENSLLLGANVRKNVDNMNGMQSAVAAGIMTTKFIELDKHIAKQPENVDTESLSEIGKGLKELNDIVKGIDGEGMRDEDVE